MYGNQEQVVPDTGLGYSLKASAKITWSNMASMASACIVAQSGLITNGESHKGDWSNDAHLALNLVGCISLVKLVRAIAIAQGADLEAG